MASESVWISYRDCKITEQELTKEQTAKLREMRFKWTEQIPHILPVDSRLLVIPSELSSVFTEFTELSDSH